MLPNNIKKMQFSELLSSICYKIVFHSKKTRNSQAVKEQSPIPPGNQRPRSDSWMRMQSMSAELQQLG